MDNIYITPEHELLREQAARFFGGFVVTVLVHTDIARSHLHHAGSSAQLDKHMPDVVEGHTITAVGISGPGAGSDVAGIKTTARRDVDHWVPNGQEFRLPRTRLGSDAAGRQRRGARD